MFKDFFLYSDPKETYNFDLSESIPKEEGPHIKLDRVSSDIQKNIEYAKYVFSLPQNGDVVLREFDIVVDGQKLKAFMMFVDGLVMSDTINDFILKPFMYLKNLKKSEDETLIDFMYRQLLPQNQAVVESDINRMLHLVNFGNCIIMIDTLNKGFTLDVKGWEHRGITPPVNENVIQGPHEAFNEMLRSNTALIRKSLNTSDLVIENVCLGKTSKTPSCIAYLKNVANEHLIDEVKHRLNNIDVEYMLSSLDLEQYIEDATYFTVPQILNTERPDRVCKSLIDGRVAIIVSGSSHVLVVPSTFSDMLSSTEDTYLRFPFSIFIRFIRMAAVFIALLAPAFYIAITNYHQELLLTNILFAIEAAREAVPFPAIVELILMELSFELIKEAGVRIPGAIGQTLSIVGGLILGQAAAEAHIVSTIMIIVVAITGIASFAIPTYSLSFSFRISRFIYLFGAAIAGFVGIFTLVFINILLLFGTKSFGVPFISGIVPENNKPFWQTIFKTPIWKFDKRPEYLKPKDKQFSAKISRKWLYKNNKQR